MSKLGCRCGHVIVDQTDRLPYKATMIPDQSDEAVWNGIEAAVEPLIAATMAGNNQAWLQEHGFGADYPDHGSAGQLLADFITGLSLRYARTVYECTACGRLYVEEAGGQNSFISFQPESGRYAGVLKEK